MRFGVSQEIWGDLGFLFLMRSGGSQEIWGDLGVSGVSHEIGYLRIL